MIIPIKKRPCNDCPFRKDSLPGWLGNKMEEHVLSDSFVCHKTLSGKKLQCAGHMLLTKNTNLIVRISLAMELDLGLSGRELVFENVQDCISHHTNLNTDENEH